MRAFPLLLLLGCDAPLLDEMPMAEANALVAELRAAEVPAKRTGQGTRCRVMVPPEWMAGATEVASAAGFPRPASRASTPSLISGPTEQRERRRRAQERSLRRVLGAQPGVVAAEVSLGEGAAVSLRWRGARPEPARLGAQVSAVIGPGRPVALELVESPRPRPTPPPASLRVWSAGALVALGLACVALTLRRRP